MKPAFHPHLALSEDRRTISVSGPYDVEDGVTEAYFWFRISQPPEGKSEVDVIGTHEREEGEPAEDLEAARAQLREAVAAAVGASLSAANGPVSADDSRAAAEIAQEAAAAALSAPGPTWATTVIAEKRFTPGPARAQGWLLLVSKDDPCGSNVYWTSKVELVAEDAGPAAS